MVLFLLVVAGVELLVEVVVADLGVDFVAEVGLVGG